MTLGARLQRVPTFFYHKLNKAFATRLFYTLTIMVLWGKFY